MVSSSSSSSSSSHKKKESPYHKLTVFVQEGTKLRNVETFGKLDPYVVLKLGDREVVKSDVFNNAGVNCRFNTQFEFPYHGESSLQFSVKDKKKLGKDREVGAHKLPLWSLLSGSMHHKTIELKHKTSGAGFLQISLKFGRGHLSHTSVTRFAPIEKVAEKKKEKKEKKKTDGSSSSSSSSSDYKKTTPVSHHFKTIRVTVLKAHNLLDVESVGKIDPYCGIRLGKSLVSMPPMRNAGTNPTFNTTFVLPYHSERYMKMAVFDSEHIGKDKPIGYVRLDLTTLVHKAVTEPRHQSNVTLGLKGKGGKSGGILVCRLEFVTDAVDKPKVVKLDVKDAKLVHCSSSSSSSSS